MTYRTLRQQIETSWISAQQRGNRRDEAILVVVLFNLPENKPREALANLALLTRSTHDKELRACYTTHLRELAQVQEVQG